MAYNKTDNRERGGRSVQLNQVRWVWVNKRRRVAIMEDHHIQQDFADAFVGVDAGGTLNAA
jgi:hypothetical protein